MDEFDLDGPELDGTFISMEFGPGGRIHQLWASDPSSERRDEQFQFCAPSLPMGEESAMDYLPGTILLGARTHPDDPWVVVRVTEAEAADSDDDEVAFTYDTGFLDDLAVRGKFSQDEIGAVVWEIVVKNRSRRSVELGELAFPLAFNDALPRVWQDEGELETLLAERVVVDEFLGGAASYVHARRLNGLGGGLAVMPGAGTRWEHLSRVPGSLRTPFEWDGIPVVYIHSAATAEREDWPEGPGEHTASVLEPGEERTYVLRFVPSPPYDAGAVMAAAGRPVLRPIPGMVAPAEVGAGLEISAQTPAVIETDAPAELETDADEGGGFVFVKPHGPGPLKVRIVDTEDGETEAPFLFTKPIAELIELRAAFVAERQQAEDGPLSGAFLPYDTEAEATLDTPDVFETSFGIESGLADALFLAEKLAVSPHAGQRAALDRYLDEFVARRVQNPGDGSVGHLMPDLGAVALDYNRPETYALLASVQFAASRLVGDGDRRGEALRTLDALFERAFLRTEGAIPLLGGVCLDAGEDMPQAARDRRRRLARRTHPFFSGQGGWSFRGFEEMLSLVPEHNWRGFPAILRTLLAARSFAPAWWSYGSERDAHREEDLGPYRRDHGPRHFSYVTALNSAAVMRLVDGPPQPLPTRLFDAMVGGILGQWALVREDGAAGDGFCPDLSSENFGVTPVTGRIGIGLAAYVRHASSSLSGPEPGELRPYLCHLDREEDESGRENYVITPWDGVGRTIRARTLGLRVEAKGGRLLRIALAGDKSRIEITTRGPAEVEVEGLWGRRAVLSTAGTILEARNGRFSFAVEAPADGERATTLTIP